MYQVKKLICAELNIKCNDPDPDPMSAGETGIQKRLRFRVPSDGLAWRGAILLPQLFPSPSVSTRELRFATYPAGLLNSDETAVAD